MALSRFVELYIDYRCNFLTVAAFAAHYGLSIETATKIVECGRTISALED